MGFFKSSKKLVGEDIFGNKYFEIGKADQFGRKKRIVDYKGLKEASKIPPMWYSWLRYGPKTDAIERLSADSNCSYKFLPNLTGTKNCYFPPMHMSNSNRKAPKTIYNFWLNS